MTPSFSTTDPTLTGPTAPDIPPPDYFTLGKAQAAGAQAGGWWADLVAKWFGGFMTGIGLVLTQLGGMLDSILAEWVRLFSALQSSNTAGFFQLVASITGDLLGVEVSADAIRSSYAHGGTVPAMRQVGANLYDMLAAEFSSGAQLTPEGGTNAAKAFLGFLMSFAIRQGNVAFFTSLIPEDYRVGDGLREYGELMARNLGLGRMARRALQPLIQTLIADPLQWHLNQTYKPKTLGATQAIRAHNRGVITDELYRQELAYDGYTDERANALTEETLEQLGNGELFTLLQYGHIDAEQFKILLRRRGLHPVDADRYLDAASLADATPAVDEMLSILKTQRLAGVIDDQALANELAALPVSTERADRTKAALTQQLSLPRELLTVAQLQFAYKANLIDLDTFTSRILARGFSADDVQYLLREAQIKVHVHDVHLTVSELETAFISGLIDLDTLNLNLAAQGYSPDDIDLLTMLTLQKLTTDEAKVKVAQYKYAKAVAAAQKKGQPIPPPPAILAAGPI